MANKLELIQLRCKLCGHKWYPRQTTLPHVCPACKKYGWDKPKKSK